VVTNENHLLGEEIIITVPSEKKTKPKTILINPDLLNK